MKLHHLELRGNNLTNQLITFCKNLNFELLYVMRNDSSLIEAVVVHHGTFYLMLRQQEDVCIEYIHDIAIEVEDLQSICDNVIQNNGHVIQKPILSRDGNFETAVVKSPIGKVQHTLLHRLNSNGIFLPGFIPIKDYLMSIKNQQRNKNYTKSEKIESLLQEIFNSSCNNCHETESLFLDHVAFAVEAGSSLKYIEWYDKVFGFKRFKINNQETVEGLVVTAKSKKKLLLVKLLSAAMSYHMCSEVGCQSNDTNNDSLKFVFGESFPGQAPNQIQSFINENGGEGLQHIALNTKDIVKSTIAWKENNVEFIMPPAYYYDEMDKKFNGTSGLDFFNRKVHEKLGVLVDVEENESNNEDGYLLQIFTKPIFSKKTIFLELIERHSSIGFGANNISSLFVAFEHYFEEQGLL